MGDGVDALHKADPSPPISEIPATGIAEQVADLLAGFRATRRASLAELAALGLTESDLGRRGRHPEFGEVELGQLLAAWVAHDLTHLAQVGEVLARRYRADVGPWRAYMPALDRVAEAE